MFFEYIKMVGCNRTSLNGKNEIVIRPTSKTQMVLGTNSSGKSSLIEIAFSPLPPDEKWFDKPGSLEQTISHKGRVYKLVSRFGEKNSYSFIVDGGENLNKGRNVTMQLELVKEYFGYTKDIHAFLTGRVKFTTMNSKQRQDWISRFSAVDFSFAFSVYNRFKRELTANNNIATYLTKQLNDARQRLMDPVDITAMRIKADEAHETLELLMREPRHGQSALSDEDLAQLVETSLDQLSHFIMTEYPYTENVGDLEGLVNLRANAEMSLHQLQGELKARGERLSDCEHKKQRMEALGQYSPEELQASMDSIKAMLDAIPPQVSEVPPSLLRDHQKVINELRPIIGKLGAVRKTNNDVMEVNNRLLERKLMLGRYMGAVEDFTRQIHQIHQCEVVSCPSCKTEFKPGIEPGKLEELESRMGKGQALINELEAEVDHIDEEFQSTAHIASVYAELDQVRERYQNVCPGLFQYLDTFGWTKLGRGLNEKIALFAKDCDRQEDRDQKQRQYDTLKSRLDQVKAEAGQTVQVIEDYKAALEDYNALYLVHQKASGRKQGLDKALLSWQKYIDLFERSEQLYENLRCEMINYCNHQGDLMVDEMIKKTKVTMGVLESALAENDQNLNIVQDLEAQVKRARIEEESRRVLVEALSPKTGLIAEQITAQMSSIVGAVNQMIKRVWGYPLFIKSGDPEDTEMDYKLPVVVDGKERADIAVGSSSVKDVVDQAFRWTGYYCMNLTDYPLFLDEFGSTFDEAHRHNLIPLIKDLVDDARFSQVLMISHSLDGQTSFPMSQTIILDDRNINYPHAYNQHVEFA